MHFYRIPEINWRMIYRAKLKKKLLYKFKMSRKSDNKVFDSSNLEVFDHFCRSHIF